jgi:hypothetical protein
MLGFACPVSEIGAALLFSGVLDFANLRVRRLPAVEDGFTPHNKAGFANLCVFAVKNLRTKLALRFCFSAA